jgi:uncharacterized protein (DUF983 family)
MWNETYQLTRFKLPPATIKSARVTMMSHCPKCALVDVLEPAQVGRVKRCKVCGQLWMAQQTEDFSKWDVQVGSHVNL